MPRLRRRWVVAALLVVLALLSLALRRELVLAFFPDGAGAPPPPLEPAPADAPTRRPAPAVRVLLIDGLTASVADGLPELSRLCARGLDVRVDNGFPTVSLPVQHVLWTGRTQAQGGIMYRIPGLADPPADALPLRVPGSIAVAESHPEIIHSFGFTQAEPALDDPEVAPEASSWRTQRFVPAALLAVASPAPLVFVHVLRVDEAGHAFGGESTMYREAATWADDLVPRLTAVAPADALWFVLADHGHLPRGGHGGAEPEIRVVRACVFGPGVAPEDRSEEPPVHLVDLHREIADAVGVGPTATSVGRP